MCSLTVYGSVLDTTPVVTFAPCCLVRCTAPPARRPRTGMACVACMERADVIQPHTHHQCNASVQQGRPCRWQPMWPVPNAKCVGWGTCTPLQCLSLCACASRAGVFPYLAPRHPHTSQMTAHRLLYVATSRRCCAVHRQAAPAASAAMLYLLALAMSTPSCQCKARSPSGGRGLPPCMPASSRVPLSQHLTTHRAIPTRSESDWQPCLGQPPLAAIMEQARKGSPTQVRASAESDVVLLHPVIHQ